jgi:hypothetical protein
MYDLKLVTSASSNYHALSLFHSKFHCPRSCFAVVFEPLPHNCYRLDSGATVLLKPGAGEEGGCHRPLAGVQLMCRAAKSLPQTPAGVAAMEIATPALAEESSDQKLHVAKKWIGIQMPENDDERHQVLFCVLGTSTSCVLGTNTYKAYGMHLSRPSASLCKKKSLYWDVFADS